MFSQADKFKIGLFVVASLLLGSGLLIWLGASRIFERTHDAVAYFSESVQGLETDSPVKFRGVTAGRVKRIRMAPDARHIEVVVSLQENFKITEDLAIKITLLGLTGQRYLEMDKMGPSDPKPQLKLDFQPRLPVITTSPSDMREIGNALDNFLRKLNSMDLERISNGFLTVATKLDKFLDESQIATIPADAGAAIKEIKEAAEKINGTIDRLQPAKRLGRTLDKTSELLEAITESARSADKMIRRTDNNLNNLSQKLDRSADDLTVFTRKLSTQPLSTIFRGVGEPTQKK